MLRTRVWLLCGVAVIACFATTNCWAGYGMAGNFQTAGGYGTDWTPPAGPVLADQGGGIWDVSLTGLAASGYYEFKILDDLGSPPADWGDPELPVNGGPNGWFNTDGSGDVTITLDTNTYGDGFAPASNRIVASTDAAFANYYATGNWMIQAGGGSDWVPGDPSFAFADQGGGLYSLDVSIATPGTYEYKATGGDWPWQWGTNGRNVNASTWFFDTTAPNQAVTLLLDVSKGAISVSVVPEPAAVLLMGVGSVLMLAICRRR